jgi:hypothetical protein
MMTMMRSMRRVWMACLLSAAAIPALAMSAETSAPAGKAKLRQQQREDVMFVRTQYLPKEMAYTPATRALAQLQLQHLEREAGSLSPAQFMVALKQVGALADNAHSGLRIPAALDSSGARLPLHLLWLSDALIVARATQSASDLAGARVLRIEGRSPASMFEGAKVLLGGNEAGRKHWINDLIERAGVLHALGLAKSPDAIAFTLQLPDGRIVERTLAMQPAASLGVSADVARLWSPEPVADERGWTSALTTDALPQYLREADRPFRTVAMTPLHALYVQLRSNEDENGISIKKFVDEVRTQIAAAPVENLIVDLRFDVGGNLTTTLDFMRQLPTLATTRTYLLVGPYTFSAGIISAAAISKHAGGRVTIVGEPIGDRLHFWSEGARIELPHSHLAFRYTDGQFNLADGCTAEPACMDDRYSIDVNGAPLDPDLPAPLNAAAYFAKRDPALEAVGKDIAERACKSCSDARKSAVAAAPSL